MLSYRLLTTNLQKKSNSFGTEILAYLNSKSIWVPTSIILLNSFESPWSKPVTTTIWFQDCSASVSGILFEEADTTFTSFKIRVLDLCTYHDCLANRYCKMPSIAINLIAELLKTWTKYLPLSVNKILTSLLQQLHKVEIYCTPKSGE